MNKKIIFGFLIVYIIAIFIAFIILLLSYSTKKWRLPPSQCPDFWVKQKINGKTQCYNIHNIQYGNNTIDKERTFTLPDDEDTIMKEGITWDGITYAKYSEV